MTYRLPPPPRPGQLPLRQPRDRDRLLRRGRRDLDRRPVAANGSPQCRHSSAAERSCTGATARSTVTRRIRNVRPPLVMITSASRIPPGRTMIAPGRLPAGLMTAIIGAPYFVWLLYRN